MIRRIVAVAIGVIVACSAPTVSMATESPSANVAQGTGHNGASNGNGHTDHGNGNGNGHDEAYPFNPPTLTVKPNYCTSGNLDGSVRGAVPGSDVTVTFGFTLTSGTTTKSQTKKASGNGKVEYGQKIVANATSVVITATGISRQSNTPFSISVTLDLTGCKACKKPTPTSTTAAPAPSTTKANSGKKPTTTTTAPKNAKDCSGNGTGHVVRAKGNCGSKSLWMKAACQHKR